MTMQSMVFVKSKGKQMHIEYCFVNCIGKQRCPFPSSCSWLPLSCSSPLIIKEGDLRQRSNNSHYWIPNNLQLMYHVILSNSPKTITRARAQCHMSMLASTISKHYINNIIELVPSCPLLLSHHLWTVGYEQKKNALVLIRV